MPTITTLEATAVAAFYRAALLGLRRLDLAGVPPKRFDASADARWAQVRGNLTFAHRIDLLLRDASFRFGAAFHAGAIFGLRGLAGDEPFGPDWSSLRPQQAKDLWNDARKIDEIEPEAIEVRWAEVLQVARPKGAPLPRVGPAEQLVAFGATAASHVHAAFRGQSALDWSQGVRVVADDPASRQFAGLLAVVDPAPKATRLLRLDGEPETWAARLGAELSRLDRIVVARGADATTRDAVAALRKRFSGATVVEVNVAVS